LTGAGRDLLREPLVRAVAVEVGGVLGEYALEVTIAEDEEVKIEALASHAAILEPASFRALDLRVHHHRYISRCHRRRMTGCTMSSAPSPKSS
jgi:hypothetical protein